MTRIAALPVTLLLITALLSPGCGTPGEGTGRSTIDGHVSEVSSATRPDVPKSWLAWVRDDLMGLVRRAFAHGAGVSGIVVSVSGVSDTTDANGDFDLPGAPTGHVQVRFRQDGCTSSVTIPDIAEGSTVTLEDAEVSCGDVRIGKVEESGVSGLVRVAPAGNGNLNVCIPIGSGGIRTRSIKRQNATVSGPAIQVGHGIIVDGEREGLGENSALDAFVIRNFGAGAANPDTCVVTPPTPTPTPTGTIATPTPTPNN